MTDFFGSFRKKKNYGHSSATSPRSSIDGLSRRSQGPYEGIGEENMPSSDDQIEEMFDQMLVIITYFVRKKQKSVNMYSRHVEVSMKTRENL